MLDFEQNQTVRVRSDWWNRDYSTDWSNPKYAGNVDGRRLVRLPLAMVNSNDRSSTIFPMDR